VVGPGSGVDPAFGPNCAAAGLAVGVGTLSVGSDIGTGTGVVKALLGVLVGNNCGVCGIGESEGDGVRSTAVAAAVVLLTAALVGRSVGTDVVVSDWQAVMTTKANIRAGSQNLFPRIPTLSNHLRLQAIS
jgi:hypothetical protein